MTVSKLDVQSPRWDDFHFRFKETFSGDLLRSWLNLEPADPLFKDSNHFSTMVNMLASGPNCPRFDSQRSQKNSRGKYCRTHTKLRNMLIIFIRIFGSPEASVAHLHELASLLAASLWQEISKSQEKQIWRVSGASSRLAGSWNWFPRVN